MIIETSARVSWRRVRNIHNYSFENVKKFLKCRKESGSIHCMIINHKVIFHLNINIFSWYNVAIRQWYGSISNALEYEKNEIISASCERGY